MARDKLRHSYISASQWLHWAVVSLILGQWWLSQLAEDDSSASKTLAYLALHKSFGITVLVLAVLRVLLRVRYPAPALPEMPRAQVLAAHATHIALYALIFILPISGWLGSSAAAYSVSWFNLFPLPDFVAPNKNLETLFFAIHHWSWRLLWVLVVVHIAAALKHHFFDGHAVLGSMLSTSGAAVLVLAFVAVVVVKNYSTQKPSLQLEHSSDHLTKPLATQTEPIQDLAALKRQLQKEGILPWAIDYDASEIRFFGVQAGASFSGIFRDWRTEIYFDPLQSARGLITTNIELGSADTADQERDETLIAESFFAVTEYPQAIFSAADFRQSSGNTIEDDDFFQQRGSLFSSRAELNIKGYSHSVPFQFSLEHLEDRVILRGVSLLDRLALGVGTGEWADTSWIAAAVRVEVVVHARLNN